MSDPRTTHDAAMKKAAQALRLTALQMPHLSGLTRLVRLRVTDDVAVAAVSASGLVLVNANVFSMIGIADAFFVVTHELLHLALDSFGRGEGSHPLAVNYAHDYVINDLLCDELHLYRPPLDGLSLRGARHMSLESLLVQAADEAKRGTPLWRVSQSVAGEGAAEVDSDMTVALRRAGLLPPKQLTTETRRSRKNPNGDLISPEEERKHEPNRSAWDRIRQQEAVRKEARRAAGDWAVRDAMGAREKQTGGQATGNTDLLIEVLRSAAAPPWELALQHWLDAIAPGDRTYARPSRRSGDRSDVVLPGRHREGWALHIVLDTSGSMSDTLSNALGTLAAFCESAGVAMIRIVQCDTAVTREDWLEPEGLVEYPITGMGGSDMTPAMDYLAEDPEVMAVLVITDGCINYPPNPPPYQVLWAIVDGGSVEFPYGVAVQVF
ncbi:vWA domain-containing protein [Zavarzinella formosa]|uniref:vWA domain-containing protein n=1 Tax=Zavarzinella formosa TaxID=360055 RepID=UPI0002D6055D|nr:VWA-like domain-containing protein [Zavarzinella formosa]